MSFYKPSYQAIFQDLYAIPSRRGLLIRACGALYQQRPLAALDSFLAVLELKHERIGERDNIIKFKHDPLSWSVWITGPVPERKDIVYVHGGHKKREFKVDCRRSLIAIAQYLLDTYDACMVKRDVAFRPAPQTDEELLTILQGSGILSHPRFDEVERAVARDCLLDAVVDLFAPFAIQPRFQSSFQDEMDSVERVRRYSVKAPRLVNFVDPLIWMERLDQYFEFDVNLTDSEESSDGEEGGEEEGGVPVPESLLWTKDTLRTSVIIRGLTAASPKSREEDEQRFVPAVFKIANLEELFNVDDYGVRMELEDALVFNIACASDRLALVERVLLVRSEARLENEEKLKRWCGKVVGWDKADWGVKTKIWKRKRACERSASALRGDFTAEELMAWEEEMERQSEEETGEHFASTLEPLEEDSEQNRDTENTHGDGEDTSAEDTNTEAADRNVQQDSLDSHRGVSLLQSTMALLDVEMDVEA